jgi:MFS family permease
MLPESPRWLASNDRLEQADAVVSQMEAYAARTQPLPPVTSQAEVRKEERASYREIFGNQMYLRRMLLLLVMWFLAYITIYTIAAGFTSVLTSLGYPPPEAGLIAAVGTLGFIACAVFAFMYGERLERKYWLPVMAVVTLVGGILVALSPPAGPGQIPWLAFVGSIVLFFGFNGWVPQTYAWSAENFPTRARVTGFGLVDGVGHVGGGVGLIAIAPLLPQIGVLASMILISGFLIAAAIIAQFGVATRGRNLDEVSP